MIIYKLKPVYLNKIFLLLLLIALVFSLILNFLLPFNWLQNFIYGFGFTAILGIFAFYLNKYEPYIIHIDNNQVYISYFNKAFFKMNDITVEKNDMNIAKKDNMLELYKNEILIARIRKSAIDKKGWDYFVDMA